MTYVVVFLFGLAVGSFLNVCIRRLPQGVSIVTPASRCPKCQAPIKAYDNIPLLSYIILRGKCRACLAPISPLYPAVELLTALLFLACLGAFGLTLEGAKWAVFSALTVVLVFTDIRERILPDKVNFFGFLLAILFSFFVSSGDGTALWLADWIFESPGGGWILWLGDAILGAALGAGVLWIVAEGYFRLRGRAGMGLGDVKMMGMVGAFLGVKKTFLTILCGSLLGSLLGSLIILSLLLFGWKRTVAERAHRMGLGSTAKLSFALARRYPLPFGAFLGGAALIVVFYGTAMLERYARFFT